MYRVWIAVVAVPVERIRQFVISADDQLFGFPACAITLDEFLWVLGIALLARYRVDDQNRFWQGVSNSSTKNPRVSGLPEAHVVRGKYEAVRDGCVNS